MTICAAALADKSRAIVCVSDKGIAYGETIQWDSDSSKITVLGENGPAIMFAGSDPHITRVLSGVLARESELGREVGNIIKVLESEYRRALEELLEINFLSPRLLTKAEYIAGISGPEINPFFKAVASDMDEFFMKCALMMCGFDSKEKPFIINLEFPGVASDYSVTGFHAIGTGWEKTISRLLFSEFNRANPVERIAYDCFDGKAFAEMQSSVGYQWDLRIVTASTVWVVSKEIRNLIERVWVKANRSPFEERKRDESPPPPPDWKEELNLYFSRMTGRIPSGTVRRLMSNGQLVDRPKPKEVQKMLKRLDKLRPQKVKRSGVRKSKRGK